MNLFKRRAPTQILAFVQERKSIPQIVDGLRKGRFYRSVTLQVPIGGEAPVAGHVSPRYLFATGVTICVALILIAYRFAFANLSTREFLSYAGTTAISFAAGYWVLARVSDRAVARKLLSVYRPWVVAGESLIAISTTSERSAAAVDLLIESAGEHPAIFVLHPREAPIVNPAERIRGSLSEDEILMRSANMAREMKKITRDHPPNRSLIPRLNYCERVLTRIQDRLLGAVRLEQGIALSAEWLLDNAYIIQGHVEDFRRNLPAKYYQELPFLTSGKWTGLPRIYVLACELVSNRDGSITRDGIESFLQTFQSETVLTTAELWALPMMIRLRLIEYVASLSSEVERRQFESEHAAFWSNRLLHMARREGGRIPEVVAAIAAACPTPSAHMVEEFMDHLYDQESALAPVRSWLGSRFQSPLEEVVRRDEQEEAADQASLANSISTLRLLSQFDWREVFEAVSHVEAVLWTDPAQIYGEMDFETRDRYRHYVEMLSRRKSLVEEEIARGAIALALEASEAPRNHVGFFLIDEGCAELERRLAVRPSFGDRTRRWVNGHAAPLYLCCIGVTTLLLMTVALLLSQLPGHSPWIAVALTFLFALPAAELAIQIVNYVVTRSLKPLSLPKMSFAEGIPDEFRTLVVVPMMLLTPNSIRDEFERLEIRALANPDKNLVFALLSDFSDATQPNMPEDFELLDIAKRGIEDLNRSHGSDRFLLFYRERQWSDCEQCWMGWERKRGKLEELNSFLLGDTDELGVKVAAGSRESAAGIRFVLTLDSDTQLPRDTAARLVATLAHPLNQPHLSEDGQRVVRGYSIIQPRVSTSLPSATGSLFTRIFSDPTGMDPYTHAVSDVYQDLAGSGTYHGKGIYDLAAFHQILLNRFPDAHLLSHDLIEGAFAHVGLASDIELLDLFPENYTAYSSRMHRWIRGDIQILDWLLPKVPTKGGKPSRNTLPVLDQWKILDNLRRSLTPGAILLMLFAGCFLSPVPGVCALLVGGLLLASVAFPLVTRMTQPWIFDPIVLREPALNLVRCLLFAAALPHLAWIAANATARVIYRRAISHRKLLEWATGSGGGPNHKKLRSKVILRIAWAPFLAVLATIAVIIERPEVMPSMLPFAALWAASPVILGFLDRRMPSTPLRILPAADRAGLHLLARLTWRFFDDFVGPKTHFLPPDNYQEMLRVELAERTSPTNIGLYLTSILAAHDFGYITLDSVNSRLAATLETMEKLERFRGHLLNWYETNTLEPLGDRFVSTVDSGNLMGVLWAVREGLDELKEAPLIGPQLFHGLSDTLAAFLEHKPPSLGTAETAALAKVMTGRPLHLSEILAQVRQLDPLAAALVAAHSEAGTQSEKSAYWAEQLLNQVRAWNATVDRYFPWVDVLMSPPEPGLLSLGVHAHTFRRQALGNVPTPSLLASGVVTGLSELVALRDTVNGIEQPVRAWLDQLAEETERARLNAKEAIASIDSARAAITRLDDAMEMGFLYDPERRLFSIGYNVSEQRLDHSYYDLLASEARLGSFLAIARGDVPTEHWWALGRPFGLTNLRRPLLSWSGTMFEYLMPLLLTKSYPNSLLDDACRTALECQRAYAKKRGIPWGISESAYSALDARHVYQYRAFGVPGLALKRGLEDDVVVSPYSSALALAVDPKEAAKNLRATGVLARQGLRGDYGFFESIDFTRHREPRGERGLVVYTYMAHHQGMTLAAIANALCGDPMQRRFHADPRVRATASLLYESVPVAPPLVKSQRRESPAGRLAPIVSVPSPGRVDTPNTPVPRTCLLSNNDMSVLITNAGGGYTRWRGFDLTRWRADSTADNWGKFCYLRDVDSDFVWSVAHHPVGVGTTSYSVAYSAEKAEIRRRDRGIETLTEIVVSPEDDAEVWRITLINRSSKERRIEITTYCELALTTHATDRTHPAFNKLFVETAMERDLDALLAWKRLRSPDETPVWVAQVMASTKKSHEATQFETDRAKFLGRGRTPRNPAAMGEHLSGTQGYVLDPIFSLRRTITIPQGARVQISVVTVAAGSKAEVLALATKYRDPEATARAFQLAWTHAQLDLRHLRLKPAEVQLYQQLAGYVLYPHAHLRAPGDRLARNRVSQRGLWAHGISGDLPIVVLTVDEVQHIELVQEVLAAHTFWRSRGLMCDLVILNEEATSYDQPLHSRLQRLIDARTPYTGVDKPGGVFLRPGRQISHEDLTLILSAASIVLVAARGSLSQQIGMPSGLPLPGAVAPLRPKHRIVAEEPSTQLPFLELEEFNGYGGFDSGGREYMIYLDKGRHTPRPWSNVLANADFGSLVTEEGSGFTWSGNSQSNRLTPWSNDPISNPTGDAIYIFDPELNTLWTPTALPIREDDPYRTRHGQGYSVFEHNSHAIEQELTSFVPVASSGGAPVRIQILRLTNRSSRRRTLTLTMYAEWTLGGDRETSQQHVVTNWDLESQAIFARNSFSLSYGDSLAFVACSEQPVSYSCDRTEVLGRNRTPQNPSGLNVEKLSGRSGAGLDPCAALQVKVTIEPDATSEVVFLLGASKNELEARDLIKRFTRLSAARTALRSVGDFWDDTLGQLSVETPNAATNFMLNRWLLYQTLSCRFWGRSGFYQSGGAFGFRDQLQDVLALVYSKPQITREHILRSAARQFLEGDVQHWWHAETGAGVRTRISDDLVWLPYVVAHYVKVTGDMAILDETVPFIEGPLLDKGEHDAYFVPAITATQATIWEHCRRAIEKASTSGIHGLPLIGGGDWNDGMNLVGIAGKGESVWLGWFLLQTMRDFADLTEGRDPGIAQSMRTRATQLAENIEEKAWDGEWYLRAFFDDGTPIGSKASAEAKIDSLPQSWAAITGAGSRERSEKAMRSVNEQLVPEGEGLVRLFSPAFDSSPLEPGYIKGYPPGVRENGGQYTHGSLWAALAWARLGNGDEAVRLLDIMSPVVSGARPDRYLVEPYVVVADVYALQDRVGMGGWTWYTGSSAWTYRIWIEEVLGFTLRGNRLTLRPVLPTNWPGFRMRYRFGATTYGIEVTRSETEVAGLTLDGAAVEFIDLADDSADHVVRLVLTVAVPDTNHG